jgi:hypothetical protein
MNTTVNTLNHCTSAATCSHLQPPAASCHLLGQIGINKVKIEMSVIKTMDTTQTQVMADIPVKTDESAVAAVAEDAEEIGADADDTLSDDIDMYVDSLEAAYDDDLHDRDMEDDTPDTATAAAASPVTAAVASDATAALPLTFVESKFPQVWDSMFELIIMDTAEFNVLRNSTLYVFIYCTASVRIGTMITHRLFNYVMLSDISKDECDLVESEICEEADLMCEPNVHDVHVLCYKYETYIRILESTTETTDKLQVPFMQRPVRAYRVHQAKGGLIYIEVAVGSVC